MPLSRFRCRVCKREFSRFLPYHALGEPAVCPGCRSAEVEDITDGAVRDPAAGQACDLSKRT